MKKFITIILRRLLSSRELSSKHFFGRGRDQTDEVYAGSFHLFSLDSLSKRAFPLMQRVCRDHDVLNIQHATFIGFLFHRCRTRNFLKYKQQETLYY